MKSRLLNIDIDLFDDEEEVLALLSKDIDSGRSIELFFLNAHCFNLAQKDREYFDILNSCDYLLNDGIGIKIASKIEKLVLKKNLNGTDFIPEIAEMAAKKGYKIFLLGAKDGIAEEAAVKLKEKFEGLQIAGVHSGYGLDESVLEMINNSKADILIAGMGVPMQEKWIRENKSKLGSVKLFVGGGAILDFLSQRIRRAPLFMRKFGLEWVFRLCLEPGRLWRRYLVGNFLFFYYILVLKLGFKTWSMR
ncbi:MAG TPA: WecB/TagA/CpsF family glycosyltransferase [Candidatus Adamsella sp.]|nr:WecB/TagA/CpsF family glycosyltransferase [Candidatus Adamsella sp.]